MIKGLKIIAAIAKTTISEAIRKKVLLVTLFIGLLFLIITPSLSVLSVRQERTVLIGLTLGIIQMTSLVISLVLTMGLIPEEIERRTLYTILSKPVQRWQFLLGKYLGAVMTLAIMMGILTLSFVLMFIFQQHVYAYPQIIELLKAPGMFFIQMNLLSALVLFFSTWMGPTINFFLSGSIYLLGSLFNPMLESLASTQQSSSVLKFLAIALNTIFPNFANYNVQNPIIHAGQQIQNETFYTLNVIAYGIFYISILLVGGILIFDRREI